MGSYTTGRQGWSSTFSFFSWFAFVLTFVMGDLSLNWWDLLSHVHKERYVLEVLVLLEVTNGELINGNKFSNLKEQHWKVSLALLERVTWTPATAWWASRPFPSANGFSTAGTGQYDKNATNGTLGLASTKKILHADVHPEDRQQILIFFFSQYFCYFPTKTSVDFIQFCFHLKLIKIFHLFPFTANIPDWVLPPYFYRP